MDISKEDIVKLARLSHMKVNDAEAERFQQQLSVLFETINKLNELDTTNVPETFQVSGAVAELRPDDETYTFEKSDMLATMPETDEQGYLRVRAVLARKDDGTIPTEAHAPSISPHDA